MNHYEVTQAVLDGDRKALDAFIELKVLLSELQDCISKIEPLAIEDRLKYGKENPVKMGFLVEYSDGTPRYSYKHSSAWAEASAQLKSIEEQMKQSVKLGKTILDENTGETLEPAEISYSKPFIKLTFQK